MEIYHTIYKGGDGEIVEKKSRFIAEVHPVTSEEEAMEILEQTRKQYWDARHHCWAYIIGRKNVRNIAFVPKLVVSVCGRV